MSPKYTNQNIELNRCHSAFRLREYELEIDEPARRGPEMERVYFVILEMAREYYNLRSILCHFNFFMNYYLNYIDSLSIR